MIRRTSVALSILVLISACGGPKDVTAPARGARASNDVSDSGSSQLPAASAASSAAATTGRPSKEAVAGAALAGGATVEIVMTNISNGTGPLFSADGAHVLVDLGLDRGHSLVLDGREIFRGEQHFVHRVIAPDGSWASFLSSEVRSPDEQKRTGKGTRDLLVHRGQTTEIDGEPSGLAVTADGAHVAYAVNFSLKDDGAIFLDGKRVGRGFAPRLLTISPDGKRWAVASSVDRYAGGETAIVDGVKGPRYGAIWGLTFSPDGKHFAYKAVRLKGSTSMLVVDGRAVPRYTEVDDSVAFTSDGRVVVHARRADTAVMVVGTTDYPAGHLYQSVIAGETVAWIDETSEQGRLFARAFVNGAEVYRQDVGAASNKGDRGPSITGLAITANGKRIAFATSNGVFVLDVGGPAKSVATEGNPIAFDAGGARLAIEVHGVSDVGVDVVPLGGAGAVRGPRFPERPFSSTVRFTNGGSRLDYFAKQGTNLVRIQLPLGH